MMHKRSMTNIVSNNPNERFNPRKALIRIEDKNGSSLNLFSKNQRSSLYISLNQLKNSQVLNNKQNLLNMKPTQFKRPLIDRSKYEQVSEQSNYIQKSKYSPIQTLGFEESTLKKNNFESSYVINQRLSNDISTFSSKSLLNANSRQLLIQKQFQNQIFCIENSQITEHPKLKRIKTQHNYQKHKIIEYKLCINCQSYVNQKLIKQHQQKCLGFKIILKMSRRQFKDFIDEKIQEKLKQLKKLENCVQKLKKQLICTQKLQKQQASVQKLCQNKQHRQDDKLSQIMLIKQIKKTNTIVNDLNSMRLKALKRFSN